jgi:hypothetical protein
MTRIPFEIEFVLRRSETVVIARRLEAVDFRLVEGSTFGGIPIHPAVTAPRALDSDGHPRTDVFAFTLLATKNLHALIRGARVDLVIP